MTTPPDSLPTAPLLDLSFDLPDVLTLGHWEIYAEGQRLYFDAISSGPAGKHGSPLAARFHGVLALISAGVVHVHGDPAVIAALRDPAPQVRAALPLALVGAAVRAVAERIEAEYDRPFVVSDSSPP